MDPKQRKQIVSGLQRWEQQFALLFELSVLDAVERAIAGHYCDAKSRSLALRAWRDAGNLIARIQAR